MKNRNQILLKNTFNRIRVFILSNIFRFLDFIFPKQNNLVVFSQANNRYSDNSKVLFKKMSSFDDWEVSWLVDNDVVLDKILRDFPDAKVIFRHSISGLLFVFRARFVVLSHGFSDMNAFQYISSRTKSVMLWHGITLKNYGFLDSSYSIKKEKISNCDLTISSSMIDSYVTNACLGSHIRKIIVTGLPRNDMLISHPGKQDFDIQIDDVLSNIPIDILKKKVILYAPTFRDFSETKFFPFEDFDIDTLINTLKSQSAYLLIRPHQNDFNNQAKIASLVDIGSGYILSAGNDEVPDVSDLLPFVDVIITDYSSIYIDLLLKDVPPIFLPYDLEEYAKDRGLAYDYDLVTPGPKVFTQKEFINAIKEALDGASKYKTKREFVKKIFHKYDDGKACERIVDAMRKMT